MATLKAKMFTNTVEFAMLSFKTTTAKTTERWLEKFLKIFRFNIAIDAVAERFIAGKLSV
ncbi:hypothetical protein TYRP_004918 [Tyrophagus putrescentiae]|nr:hypothetical protein TYRP_004918 [Tyrophagus putrescentiae]